MDIRKLHTALMSAFPNRSDLAQMVRFELGKNLNQIAGSGDLSDVTFQLVTWAEAHGKLQELLAGARAQNPGNKELQAFAPEAPAQPHEVPSGRVVPTDERRRSRSANKRQQSAFLYDVFLSHKSTDKATVRALAERLRADGLIVWFDEWVIEPGDMISLKIEEGLQQSAPSSSACPKRRWVPSG